MTSISSCNNSDLTISVFPFSTAQYNAVPLNNYNFQYSKKYNKWFQIIKILLTLISMSLSVNNNWTISILPLSAAQINAVKLNLWIKYHEMLYFFNFIRKLNLNVMNFFILKYLWSWSQCFLVLLIIELSQYYLYTRQHIMLSYQILNFEFLKWLVI